MTQSFNASGSGKEEPLGATPQNAVDCRTDVDMDGDIDGSVDGNTDSVRSMLESIQPLVRYVDQERAVIEVRFRTRQPVVCNERVELQADAVLTITHRSGFEDEITVPVSTQSGCAKTKFELVWPERWWPASMGEQSLYELTVRLQIEGVELECQHVSLGLTSVRANRDDDLNEPLLVNSLPCSVRSILHIDRVDQASLLPAGSDALLVVRDHYAPDLFFDATDRAGILTLQCVPVAEDARPGHWVKEQVERLACHPSLMGYYVGHQGQMADGLARAIRVADPTRPVYRSIPISA